MRDQLWGVVVLLRMNGSPSSWETIASQHWRRRRRWRGGAWQTGGEQRGSVDIIAANDITKRRQPKAYSIPQWPLFGDFRAHNKKVVNLARTKSSFCLLGKLKHLSPAWELWLASDDNDNNNESQKHNQQSTQHNTTQHNQQTAKQTNQTLSCGASYDTAGRETHFPPQIRGFSRHKPRTNSSQHPSLSVVKLPPKRQQPRQRCHLLLSTDEGLQKQWPITAYKWIWGSDTWISTPHHFSAIQDLHMLFISYLAASLPSHSRLGLFRQATRFHRRCKSIDGLPWDDNKQGSKCFLSS